MVMRFSEYHAQIRRRATPMLVTSAAQPYIAAAQSRAHKHYGKDASATVSALMTQYDLNRDGVIDKAEAWGLYRHVVEARGD